MTKVTLWVLLLLISFKAIGQISDLTEKFALQNGLTESSGLIFFNDKLITHNDSGNDAKLYELDTISGVISRTVTISNATNVDWEDITQDDTSIYIGDIGNNVNGNRTDLKVYKVSKTDYLNSNSITAETIGYSYSDQTDFTPVGANNTEWDAETIVSFDANNLILVTKNWINGISKAYLIPKSPGSYSIDPLTTSLNSEGLITGGTYNHQTGRLYLVGYNQTLQPFVWESDGFLGNDVFSGTNTKTDLSTLGFEQAEGITEVKPNRYFISSESFSVSLISDYAKVVAFLTNDAVLSISEDEAPKEVMVYPNPIESVLHIEIDDLETVEIYDARMVRVYHGTDISIDLSDYSKGLYLVKINFKGGSHILKKVVKK